METGGKSACGYLIFRRYGVGAYAHDAQALLTACCIELALSPVLSLYKYSYIVKGLACDTMKIAVAIDPAAGRPLSTL